MSNLGGNITHPSNHILINTLTADDLGVFGDAVTSRRNLLFKKYGISIPYISGATTVSKSCTEEGQLKSIALTIDAPCPCEDCNYEYGIDIKKVVKKPGVLDDDFYASSRFYGGEIESIQTCSGGELADSDKLIIENKLIDDITADTGQGGRDSAIVDARRVYIITVANDQAEAVSLYGPDGVIDITVSLTGADIAANVDLLNADGIFDNDYMAVAASTTTIMISSLLAGHKFTVTDGGGATAITVTSREIWLTAKSVDTKFEVNYPMGFATSRGLTLQAIDASTNDAGTLTYYINGTAYGYTAGGHTPADYAAGFNADGAALGAYASLRVSAATTIWIYGSGNITDVTWYSFGATGIVKLNYTTWGHPSGKFPALTSDDVFQVFSQMKQLGELSTMVYQEAPIDGATYCKLTFEVDTTTADLMGASHSNGYRQSTILYIRSGQGYGTSNLWETVGADTQDYCLAAGSTSDFTELLNKWSGVYGTSVGTLGTTLGLT